MKTSKLLLVLLSVLFFISCEQDNGIDYLYDETPNERITKRIDSYSKILSTPEHGWIGYYSPNKFFGAYTLLTRFNEKGSALLNSDFNLGKDNGEVLYRLDKTDKVELIFETHGLLHKIFELGNNSINGDFVFNIISATEDEMVLEGKIDPEDDVTKLILTPAKAKDWELDGVYTMLENLNGGINNSYFRNVLHNDKPIASFKYNNSTRLASLNFPLSDTKDSIITQPISIKPNGIEFLLKPDINGVILKGDFVYNSTESAFINEAEKLKIEYADIPYAKLEYYNFGLKNGIRYNYLEPNKSSAAFDKFLSDYFDLIKDRYNVTISRIYIRDLSRDTAYMHIYTNYGRVWADVTYEIKDGKVYFSLTGESNVDLSPGNTWHTILNPLFEVIIGSKKGYFVENTGGLLSYSNGTVTLINADEPKYAINYYDF